MRIEIIRYLSRDPGASEWTYEWAIKDADCEPADYNYYGMMAYGCPTPADAIACAVEHGWLVPGRG
jgi:hypothetical protein